MLCDQSTMQTALRMILLAGLCVVGGCPTTPPGEVPTPDTGFLADTLQDTTQSADITPVPEGLEAGHAVVMDLTASTPASLNYDGMPLLSFPSDAFQVGVVPALDSDLNYDPAHLEEGIFGDFLYDPPDGLTWFQPTSFEIISTTPDITVFRLSYPEGEGTLSITTDGSGRLRCHWTYQSDKGVPVMYRLRLSADPEEGFYGLGEVFDTVNHRGKIRAMHFMASELESGYNEAHVPIPLLLGSRGWGLFVESMFPGVFNVTTEDDTTIQVTFGPGAKGADGLVFHLFAEAHPLDLTRHYHEVTGKPGKVAPWALGPWIWRDEVANQEAVENDLETIRQLDLATTGYWIDRPYASAVNAFDFKPTDYPDPQAMMVKAQALGFAMALWHTPYVDPDAEATQALYEEAETKGYFPPVLGPVLSKWGPPIDFTNPEAMTWWQGLLSYYSELGIVGYKLDYGEEVIAGAFGTRVPWLFHDGSDELTMHRRVQNLYHQAYDETLPDDGGFLLCRSSSYGDQAKGIVIWPGDIDANMARHGEKVENEDGSSYLAVGGLPAAVVAGGSLGVSGFPFFASDTGGYRNAPPDKETFVRWFQHTAFTPVMQVGTNTNDLPWSFGADKVLDEELLDWYRTYARIHLRLFPYLWTYVQDLGQTGRAIHRPLGMAHPEMGIHPSFTYMLGDHILVSPVVDHGARDKTLHLPEGDWIHWFTGDRLSGGQHTVDAPLERIPAFIAAGQPIPLLRETIDTYTSVKPESDIDAFADTPGPLHALMAPGPSGAFTLYDGSTITQAPIDTGMHIEWLPGDVFQGALTIEIIATEQVPESVLIDGEPIPDRTGQTLGNEPGYMTDDTRGGRLLIFLPEGHMEVQVLF
jgi:alpha-D-xyloside xylohydrolase